MKNLLVISAIFSAILFTACHKDPDHHVRLKNMTDHVISLTIDDSIQFDSIVVNGRTNYIQVSEGSHTIGGDYYGNFIVEGDGTIKWTLECYEEKFELKQD